MAGASKSTYQREAEARRAAEGGSSGVSADKSDAEHEAGLSKERKAFTAPAGSDTGAGGEPMPKQNPGESPGAFGARLRDWRERRGRAGAVKNKLGATP